MQQKRNHGWTSAFAKLRRDKPMNTDIRREDQNFTFDMMIRRGPALVRKVAAEDL